MVMMENIRKDKGPLRKYINAKGNEGTGNKCEDS